eukprot:jgi/Tetstr1/447355/TSEL_034792.t1
MVASWSTVAPEGSPRSPGIPGGGLSEVAGLRVWHLYSWWLVPWLALARAFAFVPSPFPAAVAAAAFAVPYHVAVLGDAPRYALASGGVHLLVAAFAAPDVSLASLAASVATFATYCACVDVLRVYGDLVPRLHATVPSAGERTAIMLGRRTLKI